MKDFKNEAEFQREANKYLREKNIRFHHMEKGRTHKSTTHRKGIPDLIIFNGNGNVFFIELKMPTGNLREEQKEWENWCEDEGYFFAVCKTWNEFLIVMEVQGIKNT